MSWSFKPGDRVVCVDGSGYLGPYKLAEGTVYTIREVYADEHPTQGLNVRVRLNEIVRGICPATGVADLGFRPERFRPVRTTSIESLLVHLNTIPANRSVDA